MIPNKGWFPTSLQERAAWYQNFADQVPIAALEAGLTAPDVAFVAADNATIQFVAAATVTLDSVADALRSYRKVITEGSIGDPTPAVPPDITWGAPAIVPTGIFQRLDRLVKRIKTAPNYTAEIGSLLGIVSVSPSRPAPADMQPTVKALSLPGSVVQLKFTRGETNGILVETKLDNSDTWSTIGSFDSSPAQFTVPSNPGNLPRAVQVRARYVERNNAIGQYSDIVTTYTQPAG